MLTGCTSAKTEEAAQQETDGKEENGEKKIQIGLTVDSFVIERWIRDRDVFVATARDLGAEVNVQDAGADAQEQISQIDYFIKKHMDCDHRKGLRCAFGGCGTCTQRGDPGDLL